jgi:hypothetical protein
MPKFSALIVVVLAFLVVPALAAADPTATQITTPAGPAFVTFDSEQPSSLHVAGTTSGGTGNVDLRCYYGTKGPVVASGVPVVNGSFSTDVPVTGALIAALGSDPEPYCVLRAVPTGTVPAAPPGQASPWQGPSIGWGQARLQRVGSGYGSTPADTVYDYFLSRAQSGAMDDFDSISSCGLCDTYLFAPGTKAASNPIWWSNAAVFANPTGVADRGGLEVDGANAYSGYSAYYSKQVGNDLVDNPGFPAVTESHSVDPLTGDVTIYEDEQRSANYAIAGRGGRLNFTWTQDGFKGYAADTQIALPPSVPASVLVKTDATTPALGDSTNPVGSVTYGTKPSAIVVRKAGDGAQTGIWQARYQRTIPAGGEISIAVAYTHDFTLSSVQSLQQTAQAAIAAPSVNIDAPSDGATLDAASAHVTGTASSPDGQATVKVNGVAAAVTADGHWSADVPLAEGTNQILAVASNKLGVTANAIVSVTRPAAPAPAATPGPAPAATTVVAAARPVRCVVPKLRGKSLAKAKKLLRHAHCRLGKVSRKATERVKPGRVVTTRFKPGSRHRAGTRVRVTIAKAVRRV